MRVYVRWGEEKKTDNTSEDYVYLNNNGFGASFPHRRVITTGRLPTSVNNANARLVYTYGVQIYYNITTVRRI